MNSLQCVHDEYVCVVYILVNGKSEMVANLWGGTSLKCTFRRCVDNRLMNL